MSSSADQGKDWSKMTSSEGMARVCKQLVDKGADPNAQNASGLYVSRQSSVEVNPITNMVYHHRIFVHSSISLQQAAYSEYIDACNISCFHRSFIMKCCYAVPVKFVELKLLIANFL